MRKILGVFIFCFIATAFSNRFRDHSPYKHRELFKKRNQKPLNFIGLSKHDKKNEIVKNGYVGKIFYTRINLWHQKKNRFRRHLTKNYLQGQFLLAGSEIRVIDAYKDTIKIRATESGLTIVIKNDNDVSGKDPLGLFLLYFAKKPPKFRTLTEDEKNMIEKGKIGKGMSKEAVLVSWGYPPKSDTLSIKRNRWVYYLDKRVKKSVVFEERKVIETP